MQDLDFTVGIETSIDATMSRTQIESDVLSEFANAGNLESLSTPQGVSAFDAAVKERVAASQLAARSNVSRAASVRAAAGSFVGPYNAWKDDNARVLAESRDLYADAGLAHLVGTPQFAVFHAEQQLDAGLIDDQQYEGLTNKALGIKEVEPLGQRYRKEIFGVGGAFGAGFAAMSAGTAGAQFYSETSSGNYVSPEQRSTAMAGFLPAAGMLAGTLVGSFGGPAGSLAGQFIGGGIGTVAQSIIGANNDRAESARLGSEDLQTATGSLKDFMATILAATDSTKSLQQVISTMTGTGAGVNGAATVAGASLMMTSLGSERFANNFTTLERSLSGDASLRPLVPILNSTGGNAGSDVYGGLSVAEAYEGNTREVRAAQVLLQGTTRNPQFVADKDLVTRNNRLGNFLQDPPRTPDVLAAQARLKNEPEFIPNYTTVLDQNALDVQSAASDFAASQSAVATINAGLGVASAFASKMQASGKGAAGLVVAAAGTVATVERNILPLSVARDDELAYIRNHPQLDPSVRFKMSANADNLQERIYTAEAAESQAVRSAFLGNLQERVSDFALGNLKDTLGGASNAAQAPGDTAFYQTLIQTAQNRNNVLSPLERNQLTSQGLQGIYSVRQGVFAESLDIINTAGAQAGAGVASARAGGSPDELYRAQGQEIGTLTARLSELSRELNTAGQSAADLRRESQELAQTQGQLATATAAQRREYFGNVTGIDQANVGTAAAGMGRRVSLEGEGAYRDLAGPQNALVMDLQRAYNAAPAGTMERAQAGQRLAEARAQGQQFSDASEVYSPTAGTQLRGERSQYAYERSQLMPYSDGVDPLTATRGVMAFDREQMGIYQQKANAATKDGTRLDNQRHADALGLDIARLDRSQQTSWLSMLPETVAGMPLAAGVGSAVVPRAAQSAFFSPSGVNGSFGMPSRGGFGSGHAGGAGDPQQQLLERMARALESLERTGGRFSATPPGNTVGAAVQIGGQSRNPYTGR